MSDPRGFTPWEHDEDEFDEDAFVPTPWEIERPRDWLDDMDDAELDRWLGDRP